MFFFFFNDTATTEIYTLSLHDALPICWHLSEPAVGRAKAARGHCPRPGHRPRSEEHTSELQSHSDLVCRLLLEKKKKKLVQINNIFSLCTSPITLAEPAWECISPLRPS